MSITDILTFAFVAALLVMSPGPNGVLITKTVPTSGRAAGLANTLGFMSAFYLHGALSILGISVILLQSAWAFAAVKYIGAAYLFWIGAKALYAAMKGETTAQTVAAAKHKRSLLRAYGEGLLTNALNPKVSMFYLAAFPQFITAGETTAVAAFSLVTVHALICGLWFSTMTVLLARLSRNLRSNGFQRWLKGVTGVVFMGFGLKLASLRPNL